MYFLLSLSFLIKFERSEDFEENEDEKKNPTVLHRAPVPSIVDENWAGGDMMYYLDGRWWRQALVYFGKS